MDYSYKVKYLVIVGILAAVFIYLGVSRNYINIPGITSVKPYKTVKPPAGYVSGTTFSLYEEAPPGFPKDVILEDKTLKHSVLVASPRDKVSMHQTLASTTRNGVIKESIKLSYISDKDLLSVATMYRDALPKIDWVLKMQDISKELSIIQLIRGEEMLIITFTPTVTGDTSDTELTFQYEP